MLVEVTAIVLAGIVTFILKGYFIEFLAGKTLAPIVQLSLNHVPTAVLAALATPLFFSPAFPINEPKLTLLIIFLTILLAVKTKNLLISVGVPFLLIVVLQFTTPL